MVYYLRHLCLLAMVGLGCGGLLLLSGRHFPHFSCRLSYKLWTPRRKTSERVILSFVMQYSIFSIVSLSARVLICVSNGFSGWGPGFFRAKQSHLQLGAQVHSTTWAPSCQPLFLPAL